MSPFFGWVWVGGVGDECDLLLAGCVGVDECDLFLAACGWVWMSVTFFWLGVGECDLFLAGVGKCGWGMGVGVGRCGG